VLILTPEKPYKSDEITTGCDEIPKVIKYICNIQKLTVLFLKSWFACSSHPGGTISPFFLFPSSFLGFTMQKP